MEIITFNPKAVNSVSLIGNPTKDVELKYTPKGTAVAEFTLAVNRSYKQKKKKKKETLFMGVTLYGDLAKECATELTTKTQIQIDGYLRQQRWEKDGEKHSKTILIGYSVSLVESSKKANVSSNQVDAQATPSCNDEVPF